MDIASFVDILGVNIDLREDTGDSENQARNVGNILSAMEYLGIDTVRAAAPGPAFFSSQTGQPLPPLQEYYALASQGVRFDMAFAFPNGDTTKTNATLAAIKNFVTANPGSVVALEGPNEINNGTFTYNGLTTAQGGGEAMVNDIAAYIGLPGNESLAALDIYDFTGPYHAQFPDAADYANYHPYIDSGQQYQPGQKFETIIANNATSRNKLIVFTEFGYSDGSTFYSDAAQRTYFAIQNDDLTIGKFLLNAWLDAARLGIEKMYLYQLFDGTNLPFDPSAPSENQYQGNFGLFEGRHAQSAITDPSAVAKASAIALHNFSSALQSDAGSASMTVQNPTLPGSTPDGIFSLQFEKADGVKALAIWAEPDIWDPINNVSIPAAETLVTVKLGTLASTVRIYDPLVRETPIAVDTNVKSIKVGVTDHPVIVEVLSNDPVIKATAAAETLSGTAFNDSLDGSGGNDIVNGGDGNDFIIGGAGFDTLFGGAGSDIFSYTSTGHAAYNANNPSNSVETIGDFQIDADRFDTSFTGDLLDLSALDAVKNSIMTGKQHFVLGGDNFTGLAGELIQYVDAGNLRIAGDTDGDGDADMMIVLTGVAAVPSADYFIL